MENINNKLVADFNTYPINIKVRLKVDLTKYLNGLISGTEGITTGRNGIWSRSNDNFITVKFPMGSLDVAWNSLEIIDTEYLKHLEKLKDKKFEELKNAENIELTVGRYGGFIHLSYEIGISHTGIGGYTFKKEADEILNYFRLIGKEIKTVVKQ